MLRIEKKIDLVLMDKDVNIFFIFMFFGFVSILAATLIGFLAKKLADTTEPAAILLNDQMKKTFLAAKAAREWRAYVYIFALIGTLCVGIFQNAIYDLLKSLFVT
jgi:hypothetical protein